MNSPDQKFIESLALLTHQYIWECKAASKSPTKEFIPILIAVMEAEIESLRESMEEQ